MAQGGTPPTGASAPSLMSSPPAPAPGFKLADPAVLGRSMADIAERSRRLVADWLNRQSHETPDLDPVSVGQAFLEMMAQLMRDPATLVRAQIGLWQDYMTLWQNTTRRMWGLRFAPVIESDPKDGRFNDQAWKDNEVFDFIKQSYLLCARFLQDVVTRVDGLDPKTAQKVDFYSRQFMDAMSPSNFLMTNPEMLRKTAETGGENLLRGLANLLSDLERGRGKLTIKMADADAFKIGENIAASPGKVVFQNELMQIIQYSPSTSTVLRRPLLIVPPWTNKFYVLDLRPKNSLVRWLIAQGHTVFIISWVNPDGRLADRGVDDYLTGGLLAALDAIGRATGEREVNAAGYCRGGTLLAGALAWMAATGDDRIKSATFLATMTDFGEAGELGVFLDEEQLRSLTARKGELSANECGEISATANMLRANDLIWSFVVNNYLLGNDPFPSDLLCWNSDGTRMPAALHSFYLRRIYQENLLCQPGGIELKGQRIDLGRIKLPAYFLSAREDHITPWRSTYRGTQLLAGRNRFVLAASGHVAGIVNPPGDGKYSHWINPDLPTDADAWLAGATEMSGSWWPDWHRWVSALDATHVPSREPGTGALPSIEDAPGSYVKVRPQAEPTAR